MKRLAISVLSVVCLSAAVEAREGFGLTKRAAEMALRNPPAINLTATRVKVTAESARSRTAGDAQTLRQYVEEALVAGDARMTLSNSPEVTVSITLDRLDFEARSESKVEYTSRKTTDKNGKTKYEQVPKTRYFTTTEAEIGGTFRITDSRGREIDRGEIDRRFHQQNEYISPSREKVLENLLRQGAQKIASRIVPTTEKVSVLVPKGTFESYAALAENNAWDAYQRSVESVAPMRDGTAEAYRQYALGVAREGLAHAAPDKRQALDLLGAAAEHYRSAIRLNPAEKLFTVRYSSLFSEAEAPLVRVEASIRAYERWVNPPDGRAADTSTAKPAEPASRPPASVRAMTNETVVEMARAGLSPDVIIGAIDAAEATAFDTSPEALIELSKSGVPNLVIRRMQKKPAPRR